jgi:hypothetical protein
LLEYGWGIAMRPRIQVQPLELWQGYDIHAPAHERKPAFKAMRARLGTHFDVPISHLFCGHTLTCGAEIVGDVVGVVI